MTFPTLPEYLYVKVAGLWVVVVTDWAISFCLWISAASSAFSVRFVAANSAWIEFELVCGNGGGSSLSGVGNVLSEKSVLLSFSPEILFLDAGADMTLRFPESTDSLDIDEGMELKEGTATPTSAGTGTSFGSGLEARVSLTTEMNGRSAAGGIGLNGGMVDAPVCKLATAGGFNAWDGAFEPSPG